MGGAREALTERIRELRRRHFGAGGKERFAAALRIPLDDYERYERGAMPPGEMLVRICEACGEDLQWLLTGVSGRGTVVISGARGRHQALLARLAQLLEDQPALAAPVESFVDLLAAGGDARRRVAIEYKTPPVDELIPVFDSSGPPEDFDPRGPGGRPRWLQSDSVMVPEFEARLSEPTAGAVPENAPAATVLALRGGDSAAAPRFVHCASLARQFPRCFGVELADDTMSPMFAAHDVALVSPEMGAQIGAAALLKLGDDEGVRCRIWLGENGGMAELGRVGDGGREQAPLDRVRWSLQILYRLAAA